MPNLYEIATAIIERAPLIVAVFLFGVVAIEGRRISRG